MKKKITAVFDTETAGELMAPLVYDLGVVITDRKGTLIESARWIIEEIFDNTELMDSAYYAVKIPKYYKDEDVKDIKVPFHVAMVEFRALMEKYDVSVVAAYNMGFDMRALANTYMQLVGKKYNQKMIWAKSKLGKFYPNNEEMFRKYFLKDREEKMTFLCIWSYACEVIFPSRNYRIMADDFGWTSEKGNYLTNAEVCYRYLSKDVFFEEQHTALDDSFIETYILAECEKKGKKHDSGILWNPWRLPQAKLKR